MTLLALAGTFGCSSEHHADRQPSPRPTTAAAAPSTGTTAGTPTGTPAAPLPRSAAAFCTVRTPGSWSALMTAGRITHPAGTHTATVAFSADGATRFSVVAAPDGETLVEQRGGSAVTATVAHLAPVAGAGFGTAVFDGRWLVYEVDLSPDNNAAWKIFAWDARAGGPPRQIAYSTGKDVPAGPFVAPQAAHGVATWVLPRADGLREVHRYDLAARTDHVVTTAHVYRSALIGGLLVWQEAEAPSAPTVLKAVRAADGAPAKLPAVVSSVRQTGEITGDGTVWAWLTPDYSGVRAWRPGWSAPETVVAGHTGVQYLGLAGDLLTYTDDQATYIADLRSGSTTRATPQYGSAAVNGPRIEVGYQATDDKSVQDLAEYSVDSAALPRLPGCGGASAH